MNNDTKYLTAKQYKHCLIVISLLKKIIKENLPYDQNARYQRNSDGITIYNLLIDMQELKEQGLTCCLMGYMVAYNKAIKAGIYSTDAIWYKNSSAHNAMEQFVGFDCREITSSCEERVKSPKEALAWFVQEFNKYRLAV